MKEVTTLAMKCVDNFFEIMDLLYIMCYFISRSWQETKKIRQKEFCNQLLLSIVKYLLQKHFFVFAHHAFYILFLIFHYNKLNLHTNNPLHVFLLDLCGIVLPYVPCWGNVFSKNELVLSKCINYRVMIYESFKNIYESLKNTFVYNKCPYL
jgi:hypothetical protein